MPAPQFCFTLECQAPVISQAMLRDLVAQVLGSVGCADDVGRTIAGIESAMAVQGRHEQLELRFSAADGELVIELSSAAGRVWHMACPIP